MIPCEVNLSILGEYVAIVATTAPVSAGENSRVDSTEAIPDGRTCFAAAVTRIRWTGGGVSVRSRRRFLSGQYHRSQPIGSVQLERPRNTRYRAFSCRSVGNGVRRPRQSATGFAATQR
jgi:hypothetical protein